MTKNKTLEYEEVHSCTAIVIRTNANCVCWEYSLIKVLQ